MTAQGSPDDWWVAGSPEYGGRQGVLWYLFLPLEEDSRLTAWNSVPFGTRSVAAYLHPRLSESNLRCYPQVLFGTGCDGVTAPWHIETGLPVEEIPPVAWRAIPALDLAFGTDETLYAAAGPAGILDLGRPIQMLQPATHPGTISRPRAIAADEALAIATAHRHLVLWSTDGDPLSLARMTGTASTDVRDVATFDSGTYALLCDPADPYSYEIKGCAVVTAVDGQVTDVWRPPGGGGSGFAAIAAHGDRLAILDTLQEEVWLFEGEPATGTPIRWPYQGDSGWSRASDLALGAEGLYIADLAGARVNAWTLDGHPLWSVWTGLPPQRVAVGSDGTVFVLTAPGWLFRYSRAGEAIDGWAPLPDGISAVAAVDIAVDANDRLFVLDASSRIQVFDPAGSDRGPTAAPELPPGRVPGRSIPPNGPDRCVVLTDTSARPWESHLAGRFQVRLDIAAACPPVDAPEAPALDVVLVLDSDGTRSRAALERQKAAVIDLANLLRHADTQVGLVVVESEPLRLLELSRDTGRVEALLAGRGRHGWGDPAAGLTAALEVLSGPERRPGAVGAVVLFADHVPDHPALEETEAKVAPVASRMRRAGVRCFTVTREPDADRWLFERIATDASHRYEARDDAVLASSLQDIVARLVRPPALDAAAIEDEIPASMAYVPGSGSPVVPAVDADGRRLSWALGELREPGVSLDFELAPLEMGLQLASESATMVYTDGLGIAGRLDFPQPIVRVGPGRFFLPFVSKDRCRPMPTHALLVLDVSSSMGGTMGRGGPTKLAAAKEAVLAVAAELVARRDRVSVVAFDAEARLVYSGSDPGALRQALSSIRTVDGTRIDLGLAAALALVDERTTSSRGWADVVVLLSDGAASGGSGPAARQQAQSIRKRDIPLHTVAIGDGADLELMRALAAESGGAHAVGDVEEMISLLAELGRRIRSCPAWDREACPPLDD